MSTIRKIINYAAIGLVAKIKRDAIKKRQKRRWWVRPIYLERSRIGFFETTFEALKNDADMFFKATRMTVNFFNALLELIKEQLDKFSPRKAIVPECRLLLTLMFLAHGGSRYMFSLKFKISVSSVCEIVNETCEVLWSALNETFLAKPDCEEWKRIAQRYEHKWRMPNCLGAIDGKHVSIVCPPKAGSQYFNYKGRHSIVLLAICDADYCFSMVDIGAYGCQSDGGIFAESSFGKLLKEEKLPIPTPKPLPTTTEPFPFYFVGDNAFPLSKNLMRPFPGHNLDNDESNFNQRLSHARVTIENSFGILTARWRVLRNDIHALPKNVDNIIKACVVLHNFLMLQKCCVYCPANYADRSEHGTIISGQWRTASDADHFFLAPSRAHNASQSTLNSRKKLCTYLKNNK